MLFYTCYNKMWKRYLHSFIHYGDLYSAPSRLLLRSAPDPCTAKKKSFETRVECVRKNAGEQSLRQRKPIPHRGTHIHIDACTHVYTHTIYTCMHTYRCICMYACICMYVYVCMYMYACICMYVYVCMYMYVCMYVCICM